MKFLRFLLAVAIVIATAGVGAMFATQNDTQVPLDMLVYTFSPKTLGLWVLCAFALGGVLGMLASSLILLKMRVALGSSKRQLEKTRNEMSKLQDAPAAIEAA